MHLKRQLFRIVWFLALSSSGLSAAYVYAGTLSCSVTTSCPAGVVLFRMAATTNSHAQLPGQSTYSQLVCCTGVTGLGNSCSGTYATALKLASTTNSHVQQNTQSTYANSVCISAPAGGSVAVAYQANNCNAFDTTLGSVSGVTNAHVGNATAYTTKICASAAVASVVSVTVTSDGVITYGTLLPGASKSTIQLGDTQIVKNDGDLAEDFNIRGQNTACPWTLAATSGNEQYAHEFSVNGGSSYVPLTTSYQTLAMNVAVNGTQNTDFRITVPTDTSCFTQQSPDITIQAVLH